MELLTCAAESMLASGAVDMSMTQGRMGWKARVATPPASQQVQLHEVVEVAYLCR